MLLDIFPTELIAKHSYLPLFLLEMLLKSKKFTLRARKSNGVNK